MASPFPGMDPYLEDTDIWPGFHHSLAEEFKGRLNVRIGPKYFADVNVQTVFGEIEIALPHTVYPDVGVLERKIREAAPAPAMASIAVPPAPIQRTVVVPDQIKLRSVRVYRTGTHELVTSIEILSPYNKRRGEGLEEYRRKRSEMMLLPLHFVEIDFLRGGERPGSELREPPLEADYILIVNRFRGRDAARVSEIWPIALNEPLPALPIPLLSPDPDVPLELNGAIQSIYARSGYDWRIDYRSPVPPPELRPAMAEWLKERLPENKT